MAAYSGVDTDRALESGWRNTERIAKVEALLPTLATKEDLQQLRADLTWRIVIAMSIFTAIVVGVVLLLPNGG